MKSRQHVVIVAGLLTVNSLLYAQSDPNCYKVTGLLNTDNQGFREGCGGGNGCHWRQCYYSGGTENGSPGNYADNCGSSDCAGS